MRETGGGRREKGEGRRGTEKTGDRKPGNRRQETGKTENRKPETGDGRRETGKTSSRKGACLRATHRQAKALMLKTGDWKEGGRS